MVRRMEQWEAFRLLKFAVDSLASSWNSDWKGVGGKPYDTKALTVVMVRQNI